MKLVVLSEGGMTPWINWSTLAPPLEEALASYDGVTVLRPPSMRRSTMARDAADWVSAARTVRRADSVFWLQLSSRPELPLWALSLVRPTAQRSCYVLDAWRGLVPKIKKVVELQHITRCFVAFREAYLEMSRSGMDSRFVWLPFGFDDSVFRDHGQLKDIDVFWMGRRYAPLHEALLAECSRRSWTYRFSQRNGEVKDPQELGRLTARARYFVATPPDLDNAARTGGYSPFVMRYLEGLGAGARLLGTLPNLQEFDRYLPRGAVVQVDPHGTDLREQLDVAEAMGAADLPRLKEIVDDRHSWSDRAATVHAALARALDAPRAC